VDRLVSTKRYPWIGLVRNFMNLIGFSSDQDFSLEIFL